MAVDVGTTTLVAMLLDLTTGDGTGRRLAAQSADAASATTCSRGSSTPGENARRPRRACTTPIVERRRRDDRRAGRQARASAASGSTRSPSPATRRCSSCSAASIPRSLGEVPFVAGDRAAGLSCRRGRPRPATSIPAAAAYVMPVIGGFVGGDTVAGILATRLAEIARPDAAGRHRHQRRDRAVGRRQAHGRLDRRRAGLRGRRISHGMRGSTGAIEKVVVDGRAADQRDRQRAAGRALRLGADRPGRRTAPPRRAHAATAGCCRATNCPATCSPDLRRAGRRPQRPAGASCWPSTAEIGPRAGRSCSRSATSASCNWPPARSGRAIVDPAAARRAAAGRPGARADRPAASATSSAAATPSGSACCRTRSRAAASATRATPPGRRPAGRPLANGPAPRRRTRPADRTRRSLARRRLPHRLRRRDDFSGGRRVEKRGHH